MAAMISIIAILVSILGCTATPSGINSSGYTTATEFFEYVSAVMGQKMNVFLTGESQNFFLERREVDGAVAIVSTARSSVERIGKRPNKIFFVSRTHTLSVNTRCGWEIGAKPNQYEFDCDFSPNEKMNVVSDTEIGKFLANIKNAREAVPKMPVIRSPRAVV